MPAAQAGAGADEAAILLGAERVKGATARVCQHDLAERRAFHFLGDHLRRLGAGVPSGGDQDDGERSEDGDSELGGAVAGRTVHGSPWVGLTTGSTVAIAKRFGFVIKKAQTF